MKECLILFYEGIGPNHLFKMAITLSNRFPFTVNHVTFQAYFRMK